MKNLFIVGLIVLNMLNPVDCRAEDAPKANQMVNHTPLLKSTDYKPPKGLKRKFSLKKLVKHICLAPVNVLTACGGNGYCTGSPAGYPYYPGSMGYVAPMFYGSPGNNYVSPFPAIGN
jgi:hypothetical protein